MKLRDSHFSHRSLILVRQVCLARWKSSAVDVTVIGGGIVGLATAREITRKMPDMKVVVLEKERDIVKHQTGHNSGVIHAGIYYPPGSKMANLCVQGAKKMYEYCGEKKIPHKRIGKLIVATTASELPLLDDLYERATINGVEDLEILNKNEVRELEPNIAAVKAIYSPNTGIVDYAVVGRSFAADFLSSGKGEIKTNFNVSRVHSNGPQGISIFSKSGESINSKFLICCAGLHSDSVGVLTGGSKTPAIFPFRGSYHELKPQYRGIVKRNVYPVPNPKFPMLGVHLTPTMDGRLLIGPNAALALHKEGYSFWDFHPKEALGFLLNPGLWKFVLENLQFVSQEVLRDLSAKQFIQEAQKLCPSLRIEHTTFGFSGVRATAILSNGKIINDFIFEKGFPGVINVRNAPSPACTSSLAIAQAIVRKAQEEFHW